MDVVPAGRRGAAIGLLNALTGVAAFLAATGLLIWPYERLPVSVQ
ncbi:MAG: hypothetical protein ACYC5Y_08385 [Symbiobacteriia bacterium]